MKLFSRFKKELSHVTLVSPEIEAAFNEALEKKKEADVHFHNVKGVYGRPTVIQLFLDGLREGKIEKEPNHG